jgi:RecA-family ATPase
VRRSPPNLSRIVAWLNGQVILTIYARRDELPLPPQPIICHIQAGHPGWEPNGAEAAQPGDAAQPRWDGASDPCEASVLTSINGRLMAKRHRLDGERVVTTPYDLAKHFSINVARLGNFEEMVALLGHLTTQSHAIIIRGEPLPETNRAKCRRLYYPDAETGEASTFMDVARRWFAVDMDHVPRPDQIDRSANPDAAITYLLSLLPVELRTGSCWWQWTSSQGLPGHEDALSARLWFLNRDPLDQLALKRWAHAVNKAAGSKLIDPCLYGPIQPHYLASPVFDGMPDPVPWRHGVHRGLDETVSLVIPEPDDFADDPVVYAPGRGIGRGVDYYLERIGGGDGFRAPMTSAIGSYFAMNGPNADPEPIRARLREVVRQAPPGHRSQATIAEYASDEHLDKLIGWVRDQERAKRTANGSAGAFHSGNGLDLEALARRKIGEMRQRCQADIERAWEELVADPELTAADFSREALGRIWAEEDAKAEAKGDDPGEGTAVHGPLRRIINPVELHGLVVPPRRWIATDWIPWGYATALYGAPGVGKSLIALDLQVALALGRPSWFGIPISGPVRSFGFYCEDDEDELHRRLVAICAKYGASLKDLENMRVEARLTQNNILMTFKDGVGTPTDLFHEVRRDVKDFGASLAIWDTVADGFAGNQNDMGHARQFVRGQHSLARFIGGAALSLAHPSLTGQASHSGQSGSIQWDAAFRSRLYLSWPDTEKGGGEVGAGDQDTRILTRKKANYAARSAAIPLHWAGGAFVLGEQERPAERPAVTEVFLRLLDEVTEEGQPMSNSDRASNYAPKIFVRRPGRCGCTVADFAAAMQQLFSERKIALSEYRTPDRKTREKIVRLVPPKFEMPNPWDKTGG